MKLSRIAMCAAVLMVICVAAAAAAGKTDFHGFTRDMTEGQAEAEAKKQGFEVSELVQKVYKGNVFGLKNQVLNVEFVNGKLNSISVYIWGTAISKQTGFAPKVIYAKEKELAAAFSKKYGSNPSAYKLVTSEDNDRTHTWTLPDKSTVVVKISMEAMSMELFYRGPKN